MARRYVLAGLWLRSREVVNESLIHLSRSLWLEMKQKQELSQPTNFVDVGQRRHVEDKRC